MRPVGRTNFLIEGVSCTGKTSVCKELQRRGYHVVNGDIELAYQGDPRTGEPTAGRTHEHHIWNVDAVRALVANFDEPATFFCGGSRNFESFIHLFDAVFILDIDEATLLRRLDERPEDEFGARPDERALVVRLHRTREDTPTGVLIDATRPLTWVVDEILRQARAGAQSPFPDTEPVTEVAPEPVDTPTGRSFVVRYYRSGTMARFPSASQTPSQAQMGGLLLFPLIALGWLMHLVVFRGRWTVAVTPWHNIPGPRYREGVRSQSVASVRATELSAVLRHGSWLPGEGAPPAG